MRKKLIRMIVIFIILFAGLSAGFYHYVQKTEEKSRDEAAEQLVLVNEIYHLTEDENGNNPAAEQLNEWKKLLVNREEGSGSGFLDQMIVLYDALAVTYLLVVFLYIYLQILRPFERLERYASEIAKGNLDVTLSYERTNLFGAFTWAFDHMREEISTARKNEASAIEENKTIIATLSHDIKTPIASITTYAEALEAGLDSSYEVRQRYAATIMHKCEEVTRLTNDLVMHSLSQLDKLEIEVKPQEISESLAGIVNDLNFPSVRQTGKLHEAVIAYDEKRLAQVIENLFNNAKKYAKGCEVEFFTQVKEDRYEIHVRDHGPGIAASDMPFLFDKFYRGQNAGDHPGSGLGLYIVKYIMTAMNGGVDASNYGDGLEVVVWFPIHNYDHFSIS